MDVRQVVTDRIIAMLEKGGNVFRDRWTRAASRGMPRNGKTGQPYHGANVLLLWDAAIEHGYASNVWLTYKQAEALGAQVRKGERGVMGAHFERRLRRGDDGYGSGIGDSTTSTLQNPRQNQSCHTGVRLVGSGGSSANSTRASPGAWKSVPREARKP